MNWEPQISLFKGMSMTFEWIKNKLIINNHFEKLLYNL